MVIDPNRVKEIFLEATEQPDEAARAAFLDRACEGDAGLRDRVEALLRSHDPVGSFLGAPAVAMAEPNGATQELGDAVPQTPRDQTVSLNGEGDDAMADNKKSAPSAGDDDDDLQFLSPSTRPDSLGRLGHYEILQVLGRGGFGIVFRAFDDILQRVVAVKVMAPQIATLSPARKRFLREARSSAQVRHENVVHIYEVGEQPLPYLVMEFIPGETLQQKLDRTGPLDVPEILRIGRQIAEGLAAAHACDLIHRDIKPGNILLEGGSHKAKITDFGLARAADDASISQSGVVAGTPMFMAPEQALGHEIDQRADLFSLGSVLYQMASGRPPFRAPTALAVLKRVAEETPRPIPEIIPETPDWLCGIIAKLHAKNPDERFPSAREVADLLADCEAKLKAKQEVKNVLPAPSVKSAGRKWVVAAAVVLLLSVLALAVTEFAGVTHLFRQQGTTDPDRKAAEYVLSIGGEVQVDDRDRKIKAAGELPRDPFRLTWVGLMHSNQVTDAGLANFKDCQNLTFLGLFDTSVSDEGLANLQNCTKLTFLNLSRTKISDAGLAHFKNCTELTIVGLNETKVSDIGLDYLKNSKKLTRLLLQKTKVTAAGIDELKKAVPLCKIEWSGAVSEPPPLEAGWVQLFNGKDLTGWKTHPEQPGNWTVEKRELVGRGGTNNLFTEGGSFRNFHIRLEAKMNFAGDSGLFFRSEYGLNKISKVSGMKYPQAYEAQIRFDPINQVPLTGSLGDLRPIPKTPTKPDQWFQMEVIAVGKHIVIKVDGQTTVDFTDTEDRYQGGYFALQCGGGGSKTVVHFRKIEIKELPPNSPSPVKHDPLPPTFKNSIGMEFVIVPKGRSWLGGGKDKLGDNEVEIPSDFYLGKFEVTQEEWQKVTGKNPSRFTRERVGTEVTDDELKRLPVENVSWEDAQAFVKKLNELARKNGESGASATGKQRGWEYRLPTMEQWEYACRGGAMADKGDSAFDYYFEKPSKTFSREQANFADGGLKRPCKVGSYPPNRLGLYDMHGNVEEWCADQFNAKGPPRRVSRGGCWAYGAEKFRVADQYRHSPSFRSDDLGLRLARVPAGAPSP